MCTLTWIAKQDGFRIFFNRDEKRTRLPAAPPSVKVIDGVRVLTPSDGDAGGTWLAVNEHGVAIAVLNYYEAEVRVPLDGKLYESRGQLVLKLAAGKNIAAVGAAVQAVQHDAYRPYILTVFDGKGAGAMFKWDGTVLEAGVLSTSERPITTSSIKTDEVVAVRKKRYRDLVNAYGGESDDMLREFQHSRDERGGAFSVTMTRPDAQTVSYSEVMIQSDSMSFFYQAREMDLNDPPYLPGNTYQLKRA